MEHWRIRRPSCTWRAMPPYILPSGKYSKTVGHFEGSKDEPPIFSDRTFATEWEFLKAILLADGVDSASILKEDQATYTYENAIYSRQVTDRLGLHIRQAIICCQAYHAPQVPTVL